MTAPEPHEAMVEALLHTPLWIARVVFDKPVEEAARILHDRRPNGEWGAVPFSGAWTKRGVEIRRVRNGAAYLVSWHDLACYLIVAWPRDLTDVFDKASLIQRRMHEVSAIDWPRGVEDYYRILTKAGEADRLIRDRLIAGLDEQLALL